MNMSIDTFLAIIKTSLRYAEEGTTTTDFSLGCIKTAYDIYSRQRAEWLDKKAKEDMNESQKTPSF